MSRAIPPDFRRQSCASALSRSSKSFKAVARSSGFGNRENRERKSGRAGGVRFYSWRFHKAIIGCDSSTVPLVLSRYSANALAQDFRLLTSIDRRSGVKSLADSVRQALPLTPTPVLFCYLGTSEDCRCLLRLSSHHQTLTLPGRCDSFKCH
ncbi:hypothetical protein BDW75DRAFT_97713 [Aspergillus navahoensis]